MSFSPPSSPSAPMPHIAQQQELMRVYREELQLQQRLQQQCHLLQCLTEAAVGIFSWWRQGAAAAAVGTDNGFLVAGCSPISEGSTSFHADTGKFALPLATSLLELHPGMVFYSLGELLQLWAATASPSDFGGSSEDADGNASAAETMNQGGRDNSRRDVHPSSYDPCRVHKCSDDHPPPWTFPTSIAVPLPLISDKSRDVARTSHTPLLQLPTPAQLIRYRMLDPACPLPVTHRLLLGSVNTDSFRLLLPWLMTLTKECAEAMLLCRPDRQTRQAPTQSAVIEGQHMSSAGADDAPRQLSAVPRLAGMEYKATETIGTKRPRSQGGGTLRCSNGSVVSESWGTLCASLVRVLSYLVAAAATAAGPERQQSTEPLPPSLASCLASAATSTALRADLRLFLAEVAEVRDTVLEVKRYCCLADSPCDDDERTLKRPRGEPLVAAALSPLASVAGQGQPMAMSNMALLAHLAAIVDAQVRRYL